MNRPVIEFDGVDFAYGDRSVLRSASLSVTGGEFIWVVGPNGGGKTTFAKLLLGLLTPQRGTVRLFGDRPDAARLRVGYMPQSAQMDNQFPMTALDLVLLGRLRRGFRLGPFSRGDRQAAFAALEQVGMADRAGHSLGELSGGQQRRLLIARALVGEPELLVLDEPTANLDRKVERELFELLRRLNERLTIVMVSHDPAFVSDFVEKVVCIAGTLSVHPTADMTDDALAELMGEGLRLVRHDQHREQRQGP